VPGFTHGCTVNAKYLLIAARDDDDDDEVDERDRSQCAMCMCVCVWSGVEFSIELNRSFCVDELTGNDNEAVFRPADLSILWALAFHQIQRY